jgi:two-component system response regulator
MHVLGGEILIVEDNENDAELILRVFRKHYFERKIRLVRDGVEALDYIFRAGQYAGREAGKNPQVILLDLKLPRLCGLDVLRRIKTDERTRMIPVVVLTSSDEGSDIRESYRHGANSYVVKPIEFEEYVSAITEIGLYWGQLNKCL